MKKIKIPKILIVEDERALLDTMVYTFEREGFEVFEAMDGKRGLEKAIKHKPDILLLDIVLPEMDGLTMLQKMRDDGPWSRNVPVILLTNLCPVADSQKESIMIKHPAMYLIKTSWTLDEVVQKVREQLGIE